MTHLHVHTNFSRYDGVSTVQELVDQAVAHGHKSLAITNHGLDSMGDLFRFQQYAISKGVKPILGNESYLVEELVTMDGKKRKRTKNTHIILLASNKDGWKNLSAKIGVWSLVSQEKKGNFATIILLNSKISFYLH